MKDRHVIIGRDRVSLRVLISREDYEVLRKIAEQERNEISSLIRMAIARLRRFTMRGSSLFCRRRLNCPTKCLPKARRFRRRSKQRFPNMVKRFDPIF